MAKKFKITKSEVIQIIKEEYAKKKTEIALKKRLNEVNREINSILKESGIQEKEPLEEVGVNGEENVRSTAWTGEKNGDTKFKPEFQIKGTHKLEEDVKDDVLDNDETEIAPDEDEIDNEITKEEDEEDIEEILRKLANAIEDKVEDVVDEKLENDSDEGTEKDEDNTIESDEDNEDNENSEDNLDNDEEEEPLDENAEEPQSGHSPATEESKDGPGEKAPFTEKQNTINESNAKNKTILSEEMKRMQVMAGIRKSEDVI